MIGFSTLKAGKSRLRKVRTEGMMQSIYAPWRMTYIKSDKPGGCVFCRDSIREDDFVLYEGKTAFVMMNLYPYISGHLMIIPYRHLCDIEDLQRDEKIEIFDLMDLSVRSLKEAMQPHGFNIGMNLGKAAGAGIDDHLHAHVIPRWGGDTNFMSTVGKIRVIPEDLCTTRDHLLPCFRKFQRED
jgi:ATP adenylyltransferase